MTARLRAAILALTVAAMAVAGSSGVWQQGDGEYTLRVERYESRDYPEVRIAVSLPQELVGSSVTDDSVTLLEAGEPREVAVERISTQDLDVVIVLDTSGSMQGAPIASATSAAAAFVEQMPADVDIAFVTFGAQPTVVAGFSSLRADTIAAIRSAEASGETALYDGLVTAAGLFDLESDSRRAIVMLSDGGDTVSVNTLDDSLVTLLETDTRFYGVELQSPENDPEPLNRMTVATNGRVVAANDPEALAGVFDELASAIVNQFEITFQATRHGRTELDISVATSRGTARVVRNVAFPQSPREVTIEPRQVTVPEPPPPREGFLVALGPLATPVALGVGLAAVFFGIAGLFISVGTGSRPDPYRRFMTRRRRTHRTPVAGLAVRATGMVDRVLDRQGRRSSLDLALDRAGIALRSGEFLVLAASGAITAFAVGYIFVNPWVGVLFAALALLLAAGIVAFRRDQRQRSFAQQLPDALQLLSGSLRSGYGLMQAIETVAQEATPPAADEFHRIKVETHLGRDLDDALAAMADRVGGDDFRWVADAIEIHREIGGDLAEIIDRAAATIREREQLRRQIRALSAEGRISALILIGLPFAMFALISVTNPSYIGELTGSSIGRILMVGGLAFIGVGVYWIRKIVRVVF